MTMPKYNAVAARNFSNKNNTIHPSRDIRQQYALAHVKQVALCKKSTTISLVAPTHLPQQSLNSALQLLGVLPIFANQSIPGGKQGSKQINAQARVLFAAERNPLAPAG